MCVSLVSKKKPVALPLRPKPPAEGCYRNPAWLFQPEMLLLFPQAQQFTAGAHSTAACEAFGKDTWGCGALAAGGAGNWFSGEGDGDLCQRIGVQPYFDHSYLTNTNQGR